MKIVSRVAAICLLFTTSLHAQNVGVKQAVVANFTELSIWKAKLSGSVLILSTIKLTCYIYTI